MRVRKTEIEDANVLSMSFHEIERPHRPGTDELRWHLQIHRMGHCMILTPTSWTSYSRGVGCSPVTQDRLKTNEMDMGKRGTYL